MKKNLGRNLFKFAQIAHKTSETAVTIKPPRLYINIPAFGSDLNSAPFLDNSELSKIQNNAIRELPLIKNIFNLNGLEIDGAEFKRRSQALKNIDIGMSPAGALRYYFTNLDGEANWATNNFLKKMALTPDLEDMRRIGKLLAEGLSVNGKFNATEYDAKLRIIPDSNDDPETFKDMRKVSLIIETAYKKNPKIAAALFSNIDGDWKENLENISTHESLRQQTGYFKAITKDLVIPALSKKLKQTSSDPHYFNNMVEELCPFVMEKITASLTPKRLMACVRRWDVNFPVIDAAKPGVVKELNKSGKDFRSQWHAIIEDQEIQGHHFSPLTSQQELYREGEQINNCSAGYWLSCSLGKTHIIAATATNGERFTIEIEELHDGKFKASLDDHKGLKFSEETIAAVAELQRLMNSDEIAVNAQRGIIGGWKNIESYLGFNPDEENERNIVFQEYQKAQVLPKTWRKYRNVDELMLGSGLKESVERIFAETSEKVPQTQVAFGMAFRVSKEVENEKGLGEF